MAEIPAKKEQITKEKKNENKRAKNENKMFFYYYYYSYSFNLVWIFTALLFFYAITLCTLKTKQFKPTTIHFYLYSQIKSFFSCHNESLSVNI